MYTKLQHQRIQHLQFQLRQARRELKRFHGRQQEIDLAWAQHALDVALEEAEDNPVLPQLEAPETVPAPSFMGIPVMQEFIHA